MAILTDDADYDAGETFGNVPRPRLNFGNDNADNGPRTRCVSIIFPTNMTMLRKQGQTTSMKKVSSSETREHASLTASS
ncbi:unnamed protein product [Protopolystoma xenopodis]|uniref:Uncharacterized protein n=1 Tax=Protopolystoma xenopodis TaxID=117903 RepID=A0A3S5CDI0_9PLAT|nr:unnamed protein product [Protopolystoma xenopodis]